MSWIAKGDFKGRGVPVPKDYTTDRKATSVSNSSTFEEANGACEEVSSVVMDQISAIGEIKNDIQTLCNIIASTGKEPPGAAAEAIETLQGVQETLSQARHDIAEAQQSIASAQEE